MLKFIFVLVLFGGHCTCYGDTSESDWRSKGWYRPRRNHPSQSQSQNIGQNTFGNTFAAENQKPVTNFGQSQGSFGSGFNQRETQGPFGNFEQNYQIQNERTGYNQLSPEQNSFQNSRIHSQSTSFRTSNGQNYQNGNTFGATNSGSSLENSFSSNGQSRNSFGTGFSNSRVDYAQNTQNQNSFAFGNNQPQNPLRTSQNAFGNSYTQSTQNQNAFRANYNKQPQTQDSFGSYRRNFQSQNTFGSYSQSTQRESAFGSAFAQNSLQYQNVTANNFNIGSSSSSFGRGQNVFKGPDYLPPYDKPKPPYIAPGYLPSKDPTTTTKRPFYTTTTTRRPFYTTTTTRRPFYTTTTTRRPFYTTTTTKRPFYTTTTTRRPFYTTTTTRRPFYTPKYLPAMAMMVPPEPEDDPTTPKPSTPFDEESSTLDEMKVTRHTNNVAPAMAMRVPPEPEDDPTTPKPSTTTTTTTTPRPTTTTLPPTTTPPTTTTTTTTTTPRPTTTTTTTTTPRPTTTTTTTTPRPTTTTTTPRPTTTTTTPPQTTTTPASTTTPDPNRMLIEETPKTTTTTVPPIPYKAPEYLPPKNTSIFPPNPASMAMLVLPEPECDPSDPTTYPYPLDIDQRSSVDPCTFVPTTTTTTTPRPTTTTTTTTPRPMTTTTTTTTPRPTTTTTTTTPRPTTTTTTPRPTTTTTTPPQTTTTPASTTTPDPNRMLIEETPKTTTTTVPPIPYKAPEYLPPKNTTSIPPKPAMAIPVLPEPECDPSDPTTYPYPLDIDQRSSVDPCTFVPVRTTTKKPFVGPAYLPPVSARVGRSPKTLRLADVTGARPVWHVGLYTKTTMPYKQICGGSIVRMDVVITAAHCVWDDDTLLEPAENYAVGANKIYRPWTEPHDKRAQQSDVREIIVPPRFRGGKTSFQDDIAVLKLVTPFSYARGLRPVCVNFDDDFDAEQLSEGNSGTVAGWGYTDDVGSPTQHLLWLELPYVDIEKCIAGAEDAFLKYITSDKICAGEYHTGKALCKGDSGGGLIFWHSEGDLITPYLRGIASASARADNKECNVDVVGGFTQVAAHRRFLQRHVPDIDLNCKYHYFN